MRCVYHIDMDISRQRHGPSRQAGATRERGPRARTRRLMLETATTIMQSGVTPSVSDVAEAAGVSRATAYRYFPSEAALIHAVVDEALGPILDWTPGEGGAKARVADLLETSMPRIEEFESTFKAALKLSLDQWAKRQAGTLGHEPQFTRGHRVDLLLDAVKPLKESLAPEQYMRLAQSLSLVFGLELLVVLKDIWGLNSDEAHGVAHWAAAALVDAAEREAAETGKQREARSK
jgi:AcrR family transcriptional regulator